MSRTQRLIRYARRATVEGVMTVVFPDVPKEHWDYIIWEWTGFPCFWNTRDGIACFVRQLLNVRRALDGKPHEPLEDFHRRPIALLASASGGPK